MDALKPAAGGNGEDRGEFRPVLSFSESLGTLGAWVVSSGRPRGASLRFFVDAVVKSEGLPTEPMELPRAGRRAAGEGRRVTAPANNGLYLGKRSRGAVRIHGRVERAKLGRGAEGCRRTARWH